VRLLEHDGKQLLGSSDIAVPDGRVVTSPAEAEAAAAQRHRRCVVKAQVPTGKRGKSGAVQLVGSPQQAREVAERLLGSSVGGYEVSQLLVEDALDIDRELYAAVLNDPATKGPLLLFSTEGGMDIEEVSERSPELVHRLAVDILDGLDHEQLVALVAASGLEEPHRANVAEALTNLYGVYRRVDADLVEVNPLVVTTDGRVVALDAKISIDGASAPRQQQVLAGLPDTDQAGLTSLEARGRRAGFHFIELDGDVAILANGAGLTMTTVDVVSHYGGRAANFLEIGGDSYTKATPALELVLSNPRVRSLLVNFCGAFARTDVMTEGVVEAIERLQPDLPIFFTIHGTGEAEAVRLVRERLAMEVFDQMDDAVKAAVAAARETRQETVTC
jgi:succinyl-CoA synthetase beta subunit